MKKSIFLCAACLTMVSAYVQSQQKETPPAATAVEHLSEPPSPPHSPAFPEPPSIIHEANAPSVPPVPPLPPVPPRLEKASFLSPIVINSTGSEISVQLIKGEEVVIVKKNGTIQKIRMSTWLAKRKHYEKKYGHLPPQHKIVL